ncbi:unnamed protein product [Pipistrellus nathusii]|uniref:Secreted protein n=1 Tax=Pipistrellus nathusii TaxID=59473 RepID=A0ABN9Z9V4_PIPNA
MTAYKRQICGLRALAQLSCWHFLLALPPSSFLCQSNHCFLPADQKTENSCPLTDQHFDRSPSLFIRLWQLALGRPGRQKTTGALSPVENKPGPSQGNRRLSP